MDLQWAPDDDSAQMIADQTNPWVCDRSGRVVTVDDVSTGGLAADCDCWPIPGVILGMDDPHGIQRCDTCLVYPGDLEAAYALAQHLGPQHSVRYVPATDF